MQYRLALWIWHFGQFAPMFQPVSPLLDDRSAE